MKPKLPKGHPLKKVRESFVPSAGEGSCNATLDEIGIKPKRREPRLGWLDP